MPPPGDRRCGFTLVELMVATGLGTLVLAGIASLTMFTARSFVALANYDELDRTSCHALDTLSTEIRQTRGITSYATNRLVFRDADGLSLTYAWDPSTGVLTREKTNTTTVLLTQCDYLCFNISQRNVSNNFIFYPAATTNLITAKLVDVSWRCSRKILGNKVNTETVQTAKTVIRN
jgi:Prokaryotic N-terminal methylation motif